MAPPVGAEAARFPFDGWRNQVRGSGAPTTPESASGLHPSLGTPEKPPQTTSRLLHPLLAPGVAKPSLC